MLQAIMACAPEQVFLIEGDSAVARKIIDEAHGAGYHTHVVQEDALSIEEAREFVGRNALRDHAPTFFIAVFNTISPETAQLFLKPLEAPKKESWWCVVTPRPRGLPATLRSRGRLLEGKKEATAQLESKTVAQYLEALDELFERAPEGSEKKSTLLTILAQLERDLERKLPASAPSLEEVYRCKSMLLQANLAPKQVYDYLATVLRTPALRAVL